jgi:hypothetical protein
MDIALVIKEHQIPENDLEVCLSGNEPWTAEDDHKSFNEAKQ